MKFILYLLVAASVLFGSTLSVPVKSKDAFSNLEELMKLQLVELCSIASSPSANSIGPKLLFQRIKFIVDSNVSLLNDKMIKRWEIVGEKMPDAIRLKGATGEFHDKYRHKVFWTFFQSLLKDTIKNECLLADKSILAFFIKNFYHHIKFQLACIVNGRAANMESKYKSMEEIKWKEGNYFSLQKNVVSIGNDIYETHKVNIDQSVAVLMFSSDFTRLSDSLFVLNTLLSFVTDDRAAFFQEIDNLIPNDVCLLYNSWLNGAQCVLVLLNLKTSIEDIMSIIESKVTKIFTSPINRCKEFIKKREQQIPSPINRNSSPNLSQSPVPYSGKSSSGTILKTLICHGNIDEKIYEFVSFNGAVCFHYRPECFDEQVKLIMEVIREGNWFQF